MKDFFPESVGQKMWVCIIHGKIWSFPMSLEFLEAELESQRVWSSLKLLLCYQLPLRETACISAPTQQRTWVLPHIHVFSCFSRGFYFEG